MSLQDFFDSSSVLGYWHSEYGADAVIGGDVVVVRGTAASARDARGIWRTVPPDTLRMAWRPLYDIWLKVAMIERARQTLSVPNMNLNAAGTLGWTKSGDAAAILSVVDDTKALIAAGLGIHVRDGMVFELDNSAGTDIAVVTCTTTAAVIGSNVPHTLSVYIRGLNLTGDSWNLALSTDSNAIDYGLTNDYLRYAAVIPVPTVGGRFKLTVPPGERVRFVLPQLELGGYPTSPILAPRADAGEAALITRDGDTLLFNDAPPFANLPLLIYFSCVLGADLRDLAGTKLWHLAGTDDPRTYLDVTTLGDLRFVVRPGDGIAYEAIIPCAEARREDLIEVVAWFVDRVLYVAVARAGETETLAYLHDDGDGFVEFVGDRTDEDVWLFQDSDGFLTFTDEDQWPDTVPLATWGASGRVGQTMLHDPGEHWTVPVTVV